MKRTIAGLAALLLLAGCGPENTDPRNGRVVIDSSDCFHGCFEISKVCIGPDLVYLDNRRAAASQFRTFKSSPECEVNR